MVYALGIDFGTTFTAAAVWEQGRAVVLPLGRRSDSMPTTLYHEGADKWMIGDAAERRAIADPQHIARAFKRRMGDNVPFRIGDRDFTVQELTAILLRRVVALCHERYGEKPDQAVLTFPAEWGEFRTGRLRASAADAGLSSVTLIAEPIAAACYYALRTRIPAGALIGVYDLGGGTFDAGLVRKTLSGFEMVGRPVGDETGGIDIDQEIIEHVQRSVGDQWSTIDGGNPDVLAGLAALREQVVLAKEGLSDDLEVTIPIMLPGLSRQVRLTRTELEDLADEFIQRTVASFSTLLARSGVVGTDLTAVLLVGGGSRMPMVAERLAASLHLRVKVDAHPKYAVCLGAATVAAAGMTGKMATAAPRPGDSPPGQESENVRPRRRAEASPSAEAAFSRAPVALDRSHTEHPGLSGRISVSLIADLVQAGLTASDVGHPTTVPNRRAVQPGPDQQLVVRTRGSNSGPTRVRSGRAVPVALAASVLLALALVILVLTLHR